MKTRCKILEEDYQTAGAGALIERLQSWAPTAIIHLLK